MDYKQIIVDESIPLLQAMQVINNNAGSFLFVVHKGALIGAVSDGDIRRWIMKGGSLEAPIIEAANKDPKYVTITERDRAKILMEQYQINAIPVVDIDGRVVDVIFEDKPKCIQVSTVLEDVPVVIMAGGLGTRLYPYTKILPKPLIPIGDIPITELIINRFRNYGCKDFYLIVNHKKNMIKAYFNEIEKDYNIFYIDEDKPLGTGGGVGLLRGLIKSTFILTNCDSLIEEDYSKIVKIHKSKGNVITMVCSLKYFDIPYGVVEIGENGSFEAIKEKPNYSFFTNTGIYIVEPEIINSIEPDEIIGFPDVALNAKERGLSVGVYPINEKSWLDMGQFDTMEEMKARLGV